MLVVTSVPASATAVRPREWYLDALRIPQAQAITTGRGVTVAVIDSGVDGAHPDLRGQVTSGACVGGLDSVQKPNEDLDGHGTAMAGLIAAKGGGPDHALGVAPGAKVMPICMLTEKVAPGPSFRAIADGLRWATDHGAKVASVSLGSDHAVMSTDLTAIENAVAYAEEHDVVVVAATGNVPDARHVVTPASLPGVVAVGGSTRSGTAWTGGTTGRQMALAAPATDIVSPDTLGRAGDAEPSGYKTSDGTSNATAIVAGVAALVRAKYPDLDAANVVNRLIRTADHKGAAGRNDQYGYGIVDPVKALTADVPTVHANPLGEPAAPSPTTSDGGHAAGSASDTGGGNAVPWIVLGVVVLVAAVIIVVLLSRRRARSSAV
ncbi:MAG TPA: S8 family serine peptidase [Actinocatenispora sp.]